MVTDTRPIWSPWDNVPFRPITEREQLRLPNNARIAVWTIVNVEHWLPEEPLPRSVLPPPMGKPYWPDVPNWAWHEYGMRVGFWRFLDALTQRQVTATFAVNGSACRVYEKACRAARDAGWEFMGHGFSQLPMHRVEDERARPSSIRLPPSGISPVMRHAAGKALDSRRRRRLLIYSLKLELSMSRIGWSMTSPFQSGPGRIPLSRCLIASKSTTWS